MKKYLVYYRVKNLVKSEYIDALGFVPMMEEVQKIIDKLDAEILEIVTVGMV